MIAIAIFLSVSTLFKLNNVKCSPQNDFANKKRMFLRSTTSNNLIIVSSNNEIPFHVSHAATSMTSILQRAATEAFRLLIICCHFFTNNNYFINIAMV